MKAEEEEIDILSGVDVEARDDGQRGFIHPEDDEETAWAMDEPDEDSADWRMKIWMEDDELLM